jgi:hypothetical protein
VSDYFTVLVVLIVLLASSAIGAFLKRFLKESHRRPETADAVRLVISILVTFTALVLGLLTSSVKGSYDSFDNRLRGFAADIIELDLRLREYGEETAPIRGKLRVYLAAAIADTWRAEPHPPGDYPTFAETPGFERQALGALLVDVDEGILRLEPGDAFHRKLADRLEARMTDTLQQRWLLVGTAHDTISWSLLALMTTWLAIVFGVFGLIAPRNRVVYATILFCALSFASAIGLILNFDKPLAGFVPVSSEAMRGALQHLDAPR